MAEQVLTGRRCSDGSFLRSRPRDMTFRGQYYQPIAARILGGLADCEVDQLASIIISEQIGLAGDWLEDRGHDRDVARWFIVV